jgi:hypothetical protein
VLFEGEACDLLPAEHERGLGDRDQQPGRRRGEHQVAEALQHRQILYLAGMDQDSRAKRMMILDTGMVAPTHTFHNWRPLPQHLYA